MTLTFDLLTPKSIGSILDSWGDCMWSFMKIGVKGEAVMCLKPFYLTAQSLHCDLDLWPFDPKVHRAHTWLMGRLHVKFHEDRCKGEAVMRLKPFYLTARLQTADRRTDRQTDRRTGWFQYTPPNFVAGGIITEIIAIPLHSQPKKSQVHTTEFYYNIKSNIYLIKMPRYILCFIQFDISWGI